MAYGLKYTSNFYQVKNYTTSKYKIEIYLEGYGGSSSDITLSSGSVNMNRGGDLLENVQATTLSIGIENRTEGAYKEFRTAAWGDYKIVLIQDPDGTPLTRFVGYNQSEIYTESYDQPPYTTSIEFTDGLAHLKYKRWDRVDLKVSETAVNCNANTVSASVKMNGAINGVFAEVRAVSGTHANHKITLQTSTDDITFVDTDQVWGGGWIKFDASQLGTDYVRLKVTTVEGGTSTVNWYLTPIYTGQKTIIEVLRLALNLLPSPLPIREIVNIYEDSINGATTDSMMNQIYVASEVYKEIKDVGDESFEVAFFANQVIEEILKPFNAHIFQWNGYWYIIRPQEYLDSTMYYREYNANVGTENTVTVDGTGNWTTNTRSVTGRNGTATELVLQAQSSELSIIAPLNRVKVTYDQTNLEITDSDLIKNGCFKIVSHLISNNANTRVPDFWNLVGYDYSSYIAMIYANVGGFGVFQFPLQSTAVIFDATYYMWQKVKKIRTAITDSLQFSMDFRMYWTCQKKPAGTTQPVSTFFSNDLSVKYEVEITLGAYYLAGDVSNGYSWTTVVSRATFEQKGFEGSFGTYAANYNKDTNFVVTLPTCPENALVDFEIKIYRPYSNFDSFKSTISTDYFITLRTLGHRCVSLVYLPSELPPPDELILFSEIDEDEDVEEITALHGDGINTISVNSYRLSSGLITDSWTRRGAAETEEILPLLLLQIRDMRGGFKRNLSASLIGEFDVYNTIQDTTDVTTEYYINDYDWAIETNEWKCNLMELKTFISPLTLSTNTNDGKIKDETSNTISTPPLEPPLEARIVETSPTLQPNQLNLNGYI